MQIFSCPFCGDRPEHEFHFGGDLGNLRPEGFREVSDQSWADYLYYRNNPKGLSREIWLHTPCGELFSMQRDTVTMAASTGQALTHEAQE